MRVSLAGAPNRSCEFLFGAPAMNDCAMFSITGVSVPANFC